MAHDPLCSAHALHSCRISFHFLPLPRLLRWCRYPPSLLRSVATTFHRSIVPSLLSALLTVLSALPTRSTRSISPDVLARSAHPFHVLSRSAQTRLTCSLARFARSRTQPPPRLELHPRHRRHLRHRRGRRPKLRRLLLSHRLHRFRGRGQPPSGRDHVPRVPAREQAVPPHFPLGLVGRRAGRRVVDLVGVLGELRVRDA
jgi:hypothetical protein